VTKREERVAKWVVSALAILFIFSLIADEAPVVIGFTVLAGWVHFLWRVIPLVALKPMMIVSAFVYASVFAGGSHLFLRWVYRAGNGGRWRVRWTLSGMAMIAILFAGGLAAIGITDHARRLIASTQPIFKPNRDRERANRAICASNLHQIGLAIELYRADNTQTNPPDFFYLLRDEQLTSKVFICRSSNTEPAEGTPAQQMAALLTPQHCSYIYLGRGLSGPMSPTEVVAYEPRANHNGEGMNVLYGDGHVDWLDRPAATALLGRLKRPTTGP